MRIQEKSLETNIGSELENGKRLRILFTEGASLSARETLTALGGRHEIDVIDPDLMCQCHFSSFVHRFYRSPSFSQQPVKFLRFLEKLIRKQQYDVVLPTHEQVYLLSRFQDWLSRRVGIAMPPFASLERMQNKAEFGRLLTELDLPQPETVSVRNRHDLKRTWKYPLYVKIPHSTAGGGVFFVESRQELERRIEELEHSKLFDGKSEVLIQQPARGGLSTVQAVFNRGQLIGVHSFEARRLGVGGMSTARVSADHAIVREHMARIGRHLEWHGAFFIDYFYDHATGLPEYIECNPRIGETVNAMLSGLNLSELLVQVSCGASPPPQPPGRFGTRTHNIFMVLMSAAHEGQSRTQLFREIRECANRRGLYERSEDALTRPSHDPMSCWPLAWVTMRLLAWPAIARRIVSTTVRNYALPESATEMIKQLPLNVLDDVN